MNCRICGDRGASDIPGCGVVCKRCWAGDTSNGRLGRLKPLAIPSSMGAGSNLSGLKRHKWSDNTLYLGE